ncbi:hypothetical protein GCM10010094_81200 [Streptomyces flaveus]|uniref:Uncharacterized protein n=1 Tax=Streptomyces flaveus TaxID=66370 RepID=A0A917RI41_9ACTN|nr:hypothetical protein GCM10010094_81200 [Streptomyces flaveus]
MESPLTHRFVDVNGDPAAHRRAGAGTAGPAAARLARLAGELVLLIFRGQGGSENPLTAVAPHLHGPVMLPGRGHWTQQERPAEVNAALLDFLTRIDGPASR